MSKDVDDFGTIGVRIDTIDDITNYGKNLGKDGQLFVTNKNAISGLDLTKPADLAKAEEILGLPSGRLVNSNTNVLTEIDLTGKNVRLPTQGNEFFIPGGKTSGGAIERVIDPLNIFEDSGVKSIQFIKQVP